MNVLTVLTNGASIELLDFSTLPKLIVLTSRIQLGWIILWFSNE